MPGQIGWTIKQASFSPTGQMGRNGYDRFKLLVQGPAVTSVSQAALQLSNLQAYLETQFASGYIPGWSPTGNLFDNLTYDLIAPATGIWKVELVYRDPNWTKATGDATLKGSTSGGRQHIVASVNGNSTAYAPSGGAKPTNLGMIGGGTLGQPPTGLDIDVPVTKFNTVHFCAAAAMQTVLNNAFGLKGIVNTQTVTFSASGLTITCPAHTLKWGGWEFQPRVGFGDWEINHHWEFQPNQTNLTVGTNSQAVMGINLPGWYYLEVGPLAVSDSGAKTGIWAPAWAIVHQVYYEDDLNKIIPSSTFSIGSPWQSSLPAPPYPPPQAGSGIP